MKIVASGARYRVIDDFLPPDELAEIRSLMERRRFEEVASVIYPETDGHAFRPASRAPAGHRGADGRVAGAGRAARRLPDDPQGTRRASRHVRRARGGLVGGRLQLLAVPAGSRLGWHNDVASGRLGEFVFFLHEQWKASWAGELVILDADPETIDVDTTGMSAMEAVEAKASTAPHALTAVVPKPNRLVLVQEGTIHCINRVDLTAGTTLRQTMTGFVAGAAPEPEQRSVDRLTSLLGTH